MVSTDILIIGGGFAGVRTALDLAKTQKDKDIILISKESSFVYYPAMYRYVAGAAESHVTFDLEEVFEKYDRVHLVHDEASNIDVKNKSAICTSETHYSAEYLVLAMGSESNYFSIDGVDEVSFNFKSRKSAIELRARIMSLFSKHIHCETPEMLVALHFVIVGGGPSGVELAGELAAFTKRLAAIHGIDDSLVTIDLVERNNRLLKRMPERVSDEVEKKLRILGVNILLNRSLEKSESWTVFLTDMKLGAKTVIWTAGVRPVSASQDIEGVEYTKRKIVEVKKDLSIESNKNVFVIGDIAAAHNSGLAQGADSQARHVARMISRDIKNKPRTSLIEKEAFHVVPVGPRWGVFQYKNIIFFGYVAWLMRWVADIRFYLSILSIKKVWDRLRMSGALKNMEAGHDENVC